MAQYPEGLNTKSKEDMQKEAGYYWTCTFCGFKKNVGNTAICDNCSGVRTTA